MASYLRLDITEVKSVYAKKSKPDSRGISREYQVAHVICPGAEHRLEIREGVEVPAGWSGVAVCSASGVNYVSKFNNDANTRFGYAPDLIMKFEPGEKIEFVDPFSSAPQKQVSAESPKAPNHSK